MKCVCLASWGKLVMWLDCSEHRGEWVKVCLVWLVKEWMDL